MAGLPKPRFFATPDAFRAWLDANHASATELWVGYYKRSSGKRSITWPESVDEALCVGWIDGIRRSIDDERYMIRFTPRKAKSTWSAVNVAKIAKLERDGRMRDAGRKAFAAHVADRTGRYSYESRDTAELTTEEERRFRSNGSAWSWFARQPPGYRRTTIYWVASAKREETRARRLHTLIDHSAAERRIPPLAAAPKRSK